MQTHEDAVPMARVPGFRALNREISQSLRQYEGLNDQNGGVGAL